VGQNHLHPHQLPHPRKGTDSGRLPFIWVIWVKKLGIHLIMTENCIVTNLLAGNAGSMSEHRWKADHD
jgi:hypothetical protein